MTHRVVIADRLGGSGVAQLEDHPDLTTFSAVGASRAELLELVSDADALIVRSGTQVDEELLSAAPNLRVIGRAGVGVDNIDVTAATSRGIVVTNTPDANTISTAELTMALILGLARSVPAAHQSVRSGEWERQKFVGTQLHDKTIGIVGFGKIGRAVATRAAAFGMRVIAHDPYVPERIARDAGVELVALSELLDQSHVVTLHAAGSGVGTALIGKTELAEMRQGSLLINAARGGLVDAEAVRMSLDSGHVGGAAVDVYSSEPPDPKHPLLGHPQVVHTPHLGASTIEAQHDASLQVALDVCAGLEGNVPTNCVNIKFGLDHRTRLHLDLAESIGRIHAAITDGPIEQVEIEIANNNSDDLAEPVAAGLLSGLLEHTSDDINFISAPSHARHLGIRLLEGRQLTTADYPNLLTCKVHTTTSHRTIAGAIFAEREPRIVQIDNYHLDAQPAGHILLLTSNDQPGVIGTIGQLLGNHNINIAEWRLGRNQPGGTALSFINLDTPPTPTLLELLHRHETIRTAHAISLPAADDRRQ